MEPYQSENGQVGRHVCPHTVLWPQDTRDLLRHTVKSDKDIDVNISVPQRGLGGKEGQVSYVCDKLSLSLTLPALTYSSAFIEE